MKLLQLLTINDQFSMIERIAPASQVRGSWLSILRVYYSLLSARHSLIRLGDF
jgi:hypothetical protein